MRKMRKPIALLLAVLMLISAVPVLAFAEDTATESSITWSFDDTTGTLTISGTGKIPDVDPEKSDFLDIPGYYPWGEHLLDTKAIVIEEGITEIGTYGLSFFIYAESISMPSTLKSIGAYAFVYNVSVKEIIVPEGVTYIGLCAFGFLYALENVVFPESLKNADGCFGDIAITDSLTIPASFDTFEEFDFVYIADTLYNKSKTVVFSNDDPEENAIYSSEMYRYYLSLQVIIFIESLIETGKDLIDFEFYLKATQMFNERFGTAFKTSDEIEAYIESPENAESDLTIYCYEDSKQHDKCAEAYLKHIIFGSDTQHTGCYKYSGTAYDSNNNAIDWVIDRDSRTLTVNGNGVYTFYEKFELFAGGNKYFDKVIVGEGITGFDYGRSSLFGKIDEITLPATFTTESGSSSDDFSIFLRYSELQNIVVSPQNSSLVSIDGVLYRKLDNDSMANYKTKYGVDEIGDLALAYYPDGRTEFSISDRTSVVDKDSIYLSSIQEIAVPDSVFSFEMNGVIHDLKKLSLGANVTDLSFENMYCLEEITVSENNNTYTAIDGVLYSKDVTVLYCCPREAKRTVLDIPETVTKIERLPNSDCCISGNITDVYIRNKDCVINKNCVYSETIHGLVDSTAQTFAKNNNIKFCVIESKEIESVAVKTLPDVTTFMQGMNVVTEGLTLTVTYKDGTTADRTFGFEIVDFDTAKLGTQTVTVDYSGYASCTFDVTLTEFVTPVLVEGETLEFAAGKEQTVNIYFTPTKNADYMFAVESNSDYGLTCNQTYRNKESYFHLTAGRTYSIQIYNYGGYQNIKISTESKEHKYRINGSFEATCCKDGSNLYLCEICNGYSYREEIPALGHLDENNDSVCDRCYETGIIDASSCEHNWSEYTVIDEVGCEHSGCKRRSCSLCGKAEAVTIEAPGHEFSTEWTVEEGSCESCGEKYHRCIRCYATKDNTPTSFGDHEYSYEECITYQDCENEGVYIEKCLYCQKTKEETVPATGHKKTDWILDSDSTCAKTGSKHIECTACGKTVETQVIEKKAHTPGEWQISSAATCKKEGSKVRKCTECGETVESQKIAKTAHSMSAWNETAAPTCTEAGSRVRTCIHCRYKETEAVAATGHTDADNDGTCDTCGTDLGTNPAKNCSHLCHKTSGIQAFFWKIINFFNKLFKINQDCECGAKHW